MRSRVVPITMSLLILLAIVGMLRLLTKVNAQVNANNVTVLTVGSVTSLGSATAPARASANLPEGTQVVQGTSPIAVYSLRENVAGYSGPIVNITRSSDGATEDVYPTSSGDFPVSDVTSWAGGAILNVTKWYDQSGNGFDIAQINTANQPTLVLNAANGLPGVSFNNTSRQFMNNPDIQWFSGNGTWTASLVIQNADDTGGSWPGIF